MQRATTLAEAIHRFSPQPIRFGVDSTNQSFYVERHDDPLGDLRVQLLSSPMAAEKTLLAGHRGTGKSTELNRLAADEEVRRRYEVVSFSVKDALELSDVDHVDLLFTMVRLTYEALSSAEAPLALAPKTVAALEGWRSRVVEKMESVDKGVSAELGAGGEVNGLLGFFGRFGTRLRYERSTREVARQVIQPRIGEFLGHVNDFFLDVQLALKEHSGKQLLVLVEDLDKLFDVRKAETLFHDTGPYLADPPVRIVYTVPIALHYSKKFAQIAGRFGESVLVPNVRLVSNDDGQRRWEAGRHTMRMFVEHRMDPGLIDEPALEVAVELGGGLFQQMQRLLQKACTKAVGRTMPRLTTTEIYDAAADLRAELERGLTRTDIGILHEVHTTRQASSDEATLTLLHFLHLVEYRNHERWCDVNPLLLPTLERWKPETAG
jgi:hypothetical protein